MATGRDLLNRAISHMGEGGQPTWNAYGQGSGWAWCCAFVWRCFRECGASNLFYAGGKTAYVPTADNWFYGGGGTWVTYDQAQAGDVVIFTWSPKGAGNTRSGSRDHIGFFEKRISSTQFSAVEGNTGSPALVRRRTRSRNNIFAIYRPKYSGNSSPVPAPTPSVSSGKISVDGSWGKATTRKLQKFFGTTQDGIISGQRTALRKYLPACLSASFQFLRYGKGSTVIRALQRYLGITADGIMGAETVKRIQRFLGVKQDGYCGAVTVKALQRWLNTK